MMIGDRLKKVRKALALTQDAMAAKLGMSLRTYSRYETGARKPRGDDLRALAALGANINWILNGEGHMWLESEGPAGLAEGQLPLKADAQPIDFRLLSETIRLVEGWLEEHRRVLDPGKKAEVVTTLYEMAVEDGAAAGRQVDADLKRVDRVLRLVV